MSNDETCVEIRRRVLDMWPSAMLTVVVLFTASCCICVVGVDAVSSMSLDIFIYPAVCNCNGTSSYRSGGRVPSVTQHPVNIVIATVSAIILLPTASHRHPAESEEHVFVIVHRVHIRIVLYIF